MRVFLVAGEASGDQLGASLIRAIKALDPKAEFAGVGGPLMAAEGLSSLFPISDIAVMGLGPVIRRLPLLVRRIRETARAALAFSPDVLVTIDSPDFSKRVAKRVHAENTVIRTVHWVCPSVWAWRPGRATAMRRYIDHVLCLLPFEPEALARLHGPKGSYVGHPLIERLPDLRPKSAEEKAARENTETPTILILPGSRMAEIRRILPAFLRSIPDAARGMTPDWVIPTLPHLETEVRRQVEASGQPVRVVVGEAEKLAAFRRARAALAASGTVTLELALGGIPIVAAYRMAGWEAAIARRLIQVPTVILPNLVLSENVVPEFLQEAAIPSRLAPALAGVLHDGPARRAQITGFARLEQVLREGVATEPSRRAAEIVRALATEPRAR